MSKKRLERGLVLETEHSFIGKSPTNNSSGKAQWTLPKEKRFGWQVSTTSKVISYSDEYAESSFMKKKSNSSTTFGVSARVWFKPKRNPGPCDYDIKSSTFKRSRSTMSIPPPESSQKFRSMSMYKSDSKIRPGPGDYKTDNYQDLACQKRSPV